MDRAVAWAAAHLAGEVVGVDRLVGGETSTMLALTARDGSRSVLRLLTEEPWRTHGAELATRERTVQRQLVSTSVPAPLSLALDAQGRETGAAAHLMTMLPGAVDTDRVSRPDLAALADVLAAVHGVRADPLPRRFQSWAWEGKHVVPPWARDGAAWERAFAVLRGAAPAWEPAFLHRDFHLRNVLWEGSRVSGVVDWVETSTGPAWLDVAHCRTNLALDHGDAVADGFAAAYTSRTGVVGHPYWDVMDTVGFLPRPGSTLWPDDPVRLARLEAHLRHVLAELD